MSERAIQWYLEQWGIWQRGGLPDYARSDRPTTKLSPDVTDDELLGIDKTIAQLRLRDERRYLTIHYWYACGRTDEWICGAIRCSRVTAMNMRKQAEMWIDGAVSSMGFEIPAAA